MNSEQEPIQENPFAEAETSPWRVVGVYTGAETGDEEQEHVRYATDEVSARRLLNEMKDADPDMGWRVEKNPDYNEEASEAA